MFEWNKDLMQKNLEELMQKKHKTEHDCLSIAFYSDYLDESKFYEKNDANVKITKKALLENIKKNCDVLNYLYAYVFPKRIGNELYTLINSLGQQNLLKYYSGYLPEVDLKKDKLSSSIKDYSYDIFTSVDKTFKNDLDFIYEKGLINIPSNRKNDLKSKYDGSYCFTDIHNNTGFIYVNTKNTNLSVDTTLIHEMAHSICCKRNTNLFTDRKLFCMHEMHSIYAMNYASRFLHEKTKDDKYIISEYNYLVYLKELICKLYCYEKIDSLSTVNYKNMENLFTKLNFYISDMDAFCMSISGSIDDHFSYLLSAIASINLLMQDKEHANHSFTDSMLNAKTVNDLFKRIDFNFKDPFYATDIFNEYDVLTTRKVRKKE